MTTNMYRVGDYVYFETSSTSPYQIRRIEELIKTPSGNVEAKVMCFYRRRDLPNPLVQLADKHQLATAEDSPIAIKLKKMWLKTPVSEEQAAQAIMDPSIAALDEDRSSPCISDKVGAAGGGTVNNLTNDKGEPLSSKQRNQMKHRELFLSRQLETLPATHIRGKCSVTLLNETESLLSYLNKDDTFFYCLVFDPTQKTLLADKGEIRVGSRYQTEVQAFLRDGERDPRTDATGVVTPSLESLVWTPHHALSDRKIDQFLVVSRSVGTFARALDCSSSVKQPSLHMSAAAASRDITLFHAMDTLHKHNYSTESAMCSLVPSSGPVLCRDEMEEWSASEANLFEEALEKYGKDFNDIRQDFLPWKSLKNIVEYYYMWKTTDRYVQQKRVKAVEAELKLKQVYIPNYPKTGAASALVGNAVAKGVMNGNSGPAVASNGGNNNIANSNNNDVITINGGKPCESCSETASPHWYAWGPTHLCQTCWTYWKKYGGLKVASSRLAADSELELLKKKTSSNDADDGGVPADVSSRPPHRCSIVNCGKEFKVKSHLARHYAQAHGIAIRSGSPRPIMKTRTAFYLHTTGVTKLSRRLCRQIIRSKKAARQPSFAINIQAVKLEFATAIAGKQPLTNVAHLLVYKKKNRGSVTHIADRLGNPGPVVSDWLILTPKENMPKPDVVSFPKPPKAADGSLMYDRIPNKPEAEKIALNAVATTTPSSSSPTHSTITSTPPGPPTTNTGTTTPVAVVQPQLTTPPLVQPPVSLVMPSATAPSTPTSKSNLTINPLKRRTYDDSNGVDRPAVIGPPAKRPNKDPMPSHRPTPEQYAAMMAAAAAAGQPLPRHHMNGKPKIAQMTRTGSGRKQVISWTDAPDDVYFRVNDVSRKTRKALTNIELRRAARKPWRPLHIKSSVAAMLFPPVPSSAPNSLPPSLSLPPHGFPSGLVPSAVSPSVLHSSHHQTSATPALNALAMHAAAASNSTSSSASASLSTGPLSGLSGVANQLHQQTHLLQQAIHNASPQTTPTVPVLPSTSSDLQVVILD